MLVLLASVAACSAQSKTNSGTAAKEPQQSFVGDVPTTIADSVVETLKFVEGSFLRLAEAMPEDKVGIHSDSRKVRRRSHREALCRPNTKLGISIISVWHMTYHYGQLVEYLRMNTIVPPMTQKYGLKAR